MLGRGDHNNKYAYITSFQSGDLSSFRIENDGSLVLLNPVAAGAGDP